MILDLDPGALRTLHWHPTADEWQYVIDGTVSVTMFGSHGRYRTETLAKGDVGYIPQGYGHSVENVGNTAVSRPDRLQHGRLRVDRPHALDRSANPADVLATNFGKPATLFESFPQGDVFIADKEGHYSSIRNGAADR